MLISQSSKENKPYPLRRQSAVTDIKANVSRWTKVKAVFKWEKLDAKNSEQSGVGGAAGKQEIAR